MTRCKHTQQLYNIFISSSFLLGFSQGMAENCNSLLWKRIFPLQMLHSGVKFPYTWQRVNFARFWIRSLLLLICFCIFWVARRRYLKPWTMPPELEYMLIRSLAMWSRVIKRDMAHALLFQSTSYQKRWSIYFFATVSNWLLRHKIATVKFFQKICWDILGYTSIVWCKEPSSVGYMRLLI